MAANSNNSPATTSTPTGAPPASCRVTVKQRIGAAEADVVATLLPAGDSYLHCRTIRFAGGAIHCLDDENEPLVVEFGENFGRVDIAVPGLSGSHQLVCQGMTQVDLVGNDTGFIERFVYSPHANTIHRHVLMKQIFKLHAGGEKIVLGANGGVWFRDRSKEAVLSVNDNWTETLKSGSRLTSCGNGVLYLLEGDLIAREFRHLSDCFVECHYGIRERQWSWILSEEHSSSATAGILDTVTVCSEGALVLWNTHSVARFSGIDLFSPDGFHVVRAAGADTFGLWKDGMLLGIGEYIEDAFSDEQETYGGWRWSASEAQVPEGAVGTSFREVVMVLLVLFALIVGFFVPLAAVTMAIGFGMLGLYLQLRGSVARFLALFSP